MPVFHNRLCPLLNQSTLSAGLLWGSFSPPWELHAKFSNIYIYIPQGTRSNTSPDPPRSPYPQPPTSEADAPRLSMPPNPQAMSSVSATSPACCRSLSWQARWRTKGFGCRVFTSASRDIRGTQSTEPVAGCRNRPSSGSKSRRCRVSQ